MLSENFIIKDFMFSTIGSLFENKLLRYTHTPHVQSGHTNQGLKKKKSAKYISLIILVKPAQHLWNKHPKKKNNNSCSNLLRSKTQLKTLLHNGQYILFSLIFVPYIINLINFYYCSVAVNIFYLQLLSCLKVY